jgi:ubiquinol-cytochrome c reductase cytochrome c1 subunit
MKNFMKTMTIAICSTVAIGLSTPAFSAGGGNQNLDKVYLNASDKTSLKNGASIFANYCLSCHSAEYARYNRVAADLDIPLDALKDTLMFASEKTGDNMITHMSKEDAKKWFGVTPPDLTLVSKVRKPDWVYTYLRSFYKDESTVSGWNNSLFPNVAMPHVLFGMQGSAKLISLPEGGGHGHEAAAEGDHKDESHGEHAATPQDESIYVAGGAKFDMANRGTMSNVEFDAAMRDVTNYLAYLAEPAQLQRKTIGVWTIVFLIILLLLAMVLKKEFWRDVH